MILQQQIRIVPAPWNIPSEPPSLTWTSTAVNGSSPQPLTLVQGAPVSPQKLFTAIVPSHHVTPTTAGNGTEHSRRRRYTPRATPLTNEAVMELIKAKRAEVKRPDALASGSTARVQPHPSRWSNIVEAMTTAGHPGMEAEKLRKKWNNLCGAFRKVAQYQKVPGNKSFWLLTPAEKRDKEVDVSIARAAYDAIAEFMCDRRAAANAANHTDVLRLEDTPHQQPQGLAPAGDLPEDGDGVGEVERVGTGHTQGGGEATEGSTPGSVAGNGEQAKRANLRKRKPRPAASSLNSMTSAFIATMKDLTVLMDKQAEAKRVCMREQREGMMQHWTQQAAAIENQTNTIMNAILSTGRELAASIASVAAAIGSLQNRPPALTTPTTRSTFDSPPEFDAVYNDARPRAEAWAGPGGAFEAPIGTEWQPSQSPPQ
ncbi:hypothetical protein CBR_g5721 [Chara braunii]|uniref:Myb-like domain-containing protein n=1 Tax=Chara braunii TaxID=69332 RepID=A0A388KJ79_CHABU|nr:hypothetical protein CBR_g5721 [Chara braunii]|eukprot:GBG70089.1 hypothetical protein CBR_g5721 [Chara braunii]